MIWIKEWAKQSGWYWYSFDGKTVGGVCFEHAVDLSLVYYNSYPMPNYYLAGPIEPPLPLKD